jgi:hypothetical protein
MAMDAGVLRACLDCTNTKIHGCKMSIIVGTDRGRPCTTGAGILSVSLMRQRVPSSCNTCNRLN